MSLRTIFLLFTIITVQVQWMESAKILGLFTSQSKSHLIIHMSVAKALIERGHDLTIVTTIDLPDSDYKYRHIKVPGSDITGLITNITKMNNVEQILNSFNVIRKMVDNSKTALQSAEMKKLMAEETFDLLLLGYFINEYEIGIAAHFKCPTIIIWMSQPIYALNGLVGNPNEITHIPHPIWGGITDMGFFNRVKNSLLAMIDYSLWWTLRWSYNNYYQELFPSEKYPPYEEASKNVSLILSNYHFSQGIIRAQVPAIVQIGGIAIEENPKKLPQDIQKHLDSAGKDGAIFFSLGSNVKSTDLGVNATKAIYNVLSTLKQKVIWKWEAGELPGNAKNILFKKWFPQNSVLAHPNLKLFITHGGKGSVVESEYFGVPMIGLPVFGDQSTSINEMVAKGYGLRLDRFTLSEESLMNAINEILTNSYYSKKVKTFQSLFRDRPMTPKETVVYWVEYILRNNGAKHMQSPAVHMPLYQLMALDVMAFLGIILYLIYKVAKFVFKILWKIFCYVCCCIYFRPSIKSYKINKKNFKHE